MALWDITTGECERVFSVNGSVVCLQVVGNSVVAGFGDNSIQIWEWYAVHSHTLAQFNLGSARQARSHKSKMADQGQEFCRRIPSETALKQFKTT
jgi:hypothetical protein